MKKSDPDVTIEEIVNIIGWLQRSSMLSAKKLFEVRMTDGFSTAFGRYSLILLSDRCGPI